MLHDDLDQAVYEQKNGDVDLDQVVQEAHREYRERERFDRGVYSSHGAYLSQRRAREIFWRCVQAYRETRNLPPICATPYDPDVFARKLVPDAIHYLVDIENASRAVLSPGLFELWKRLVAGEAIPERDLKEMEKLCGRVYDKRNLTPVRYFTYVKKGRPDRRMNTAVEVAA